MKEHKDMERVVSLQGTAELIFFSSFVQKLRVTRRVFVPALLYKFLLN